jgi:hypothetical protein
MVRCDSENRQQRQRIKGSDRMAALQRLHWRGENRQMVGQDERIELAALSATRRYGSSSNT